MKEKLLDKLYTLIGLILYLLLRIYFAIRGFISYEIVYIKATIKRPFYWVCVLIVSLIMYFSTH